MQSLVGVGTERDMNMQLVFRRRELAFDFLLCLWQTPWKVVCLGLKPWRISLPKSLEASAERYWRTLCFHFHLYRYPTTLGVASHNSSASSPRRSAFCV
jgi:hypothetical protein